MKVEESHFAHHWFKIFREGREDFKTIQDVEGRQPLESREELQKFTNRWPQTVKWL